MRNRSHESDMFGSCASVVEKWEYVNPAFPNQVWYSQIGDPAFRTKEEESVISDVVSLRPEVRVDPETGSWKRIHYRKVKYASGRYGVNSAKLLRPCHPCHHVKTKVKYLKNLTIADTVTAFAGSPIWERTQTRTVEHDTGITAILDNVSFISDPADIVWGSSDGSYVADEYRTHDWFALTAAFNEQCDQFIPSSFLLGEDIAQNAIFIDAFKAVLNPTRAIANLLSGVIRSGSKVRKMRLGELLSYSKKRAANSFLGYQFGVKPAIEDIKETLLAHRKVSGRLNFLSQHPGRYVPVRVRSQLASSISNVPLAIPNPDIETGYQWQCDHKTTTAVIGAYGRVREDLNFGDTWSAYLQYFGINKVLGLAWELIPFSFVVDWFTNAQEYINYYGRLNTVSPFTEITRLWASEKKEIQEDLYCIPGFSPSRGMRMISPSDPFVVASRYITDYSRYTSIPDVSGVVDTSALGLFHLLSSAALIVQRQK